MVQGKQSQQNKPNQKAGGGMAKPSKAKEGGAAAKPKHSKSAGPAGTSKGGAKAERTSKGPGFKGDVKKGKPAGGSKGGSFKGGARKPFKAGGSSKPKQYLPIEKPVDEFLVQCKLMWNELREKQTTKERKRELVILLCKKLEGKVVDIVMKHDASRIVQTLVRLATAEEKLALMTELKGKFLELAKSKYGHQLIAKALRRGSPEVRALMTAEFRGQMSRLATHMIGAVIVEEGFARCWTGKESWELYQEFYGSEFIHFKAEQPTLQKIIAKDPSKASSIKNRLHSILTKQADKNLLSLTFVHRIMDDFFFLADPRTAVAAVPPFREAIVAMMSSRPGGRAAIKCLGYGSAKDRKVMLRSVKDNAAEAACHDQGHLVLVKALDVVDDTVLLRKSILDTLQDNLADIATDKYGRKLFLHLLARGNRHYFTPYDLKLLQAEQVPHPDTTVETPEHEIELVPSSKKDDDVRRGELLAVMKPVLTELCLTRMALLARNQWSAPLVLECLRRWRDPEIGQALADLLEDDVDHTAVEVAAARAVKSVSVAGTDAAKAHFGGGDSDDEEPAEDDDEEQGGSDDENDEEEEEEEGSESENDEAMPAAEAEAEEERLHLLEHPPSHLLLKLLLKMEIAEGGNMFTVAPTLFPGEVSDQPEVDESAKSFAARMLEHMSGKLFDFAKLSNRSAFIVVALLESPTTAEATKMELMKHVDALKALEQNPGVRTMLQVLGVTKAPVKTPGKTPKRKRGDDGAAKTPARSAKKTPKRVGTPKTPDQSTGTVFTPDTGRRRSARTRQSTAKKQRK